VEEEWGEGVGVRLSDRKWVERTMLWKTGRGDEGREKPVAHGGQRKALLCARERERECVCVCRGRDRECERREEEDVYRMIGQ
jgi:hypothetical protein